MSDKEGSKHGDKEQEKRDTDGQPTTPINPDTIREPKPGKRGSEAWTSSSPMNSSPAVI